jgi:hypothetical protein
MKNVISQQIIDFDEPMFVRIALTTLLFVEAHSR